MATAQDVMNAAHRAQQEAGPRPERKPINASTGTTITAPSPSLHSAVIRHIDGYNETTAPYLKPAEEAFDAMYGAVQSIINLRNTLNQDHSMPPDLRLLDLAGEARKWQAAASKAYDSAHKRLEQGLKALDESLNKPLTQDSNAGSINSDVRNHLKGLKSAERTQQLDQSMKDGDHTTLRAVLSAPGYLSGISEDERKIRIHAYHVMTQPEVAQRAACMRRAIEILDTNGPLLHTQVELALGGKGAWAKVQQIETRKAAVAAARKSA